MLRWVLVALLLLSGPAAFAADLSPGGTGKVVEVVDGDTVVLETPIRGAREVRLVGLQAPKLPLGRKGFKKWPLADESKRALEDLVLGRRVTLGHGGRSMDRHGRLLAHLTRTDDGLWVQGEMLSKGMARVYTFADNRARVPDMLARERRARADRRGIWNHPYYALRDPRDLDRRLGTFQVVEGTVRNAAEVRGTVYLNFGRDWRTDFTVMLRPKVARLFIKQGLAPLSWNGRTIRVRGWLKKRNGPMIEATHPEQVELLAPSRSHR